MDDPETLRPGTGELLYELRIELLVAMAALSQVFAIGYTMLQGAQMEGIFASMNVELSGLTWTSLLACHLVVGYWYWTVPLAAWACLRLLFVEPFKLAARAHAAGREERGLTRFGLALALGGAALGLGLVNWTLQLSLYLPMLKLVNNVG